ncbi:MAG: MFS transporter [Spirochaetaceae bacterium]|nr:MAG: MFS transporter [Spirochaetaceae bacterium]
MAAMRNPWLILIAGVVGTLASLPGQTNGISPFIDFLIESLALSRVHLSLAYLIGTISSAAVMPYAGALYDRYGSRRLSLVSGFALGLSVLAISYVDRIAQSLIALLPLVSRAIVATAVMAAAFFLVRFFGQGILNMASRNMVMKWFDSRRGLATACMAPLIALGFAYAPRVFDAMIGIWGWRGSWRVMALLLLTLFSLFVRLLFSDPSQEERRTARNARSLRLPVPKTMRRALNARAEREPPRPKEDFTLEQARKTLIFWLFNMTNGFSSLVGTGFTFHVVALFAAAGMSRATALAVFFPATTIAVVLQFVAGIVSDYVRLKYFAAVHMAGIFVMMTALMFLGSGTPYAVLVVGMALNTAMMNINTVITWPRFFGITHLGRISGVAFVWMVAGSAIGPYVYSLSEWATGSYFLVALVFALVAAALFVLSFLAENPNRVEPSRSDDLTTMHRRGS